MSSQLRAVGFCGADDSVHPNHLSVISHAFPVTEWGVLFRPDKEGLPRYASVQWVEQLAAAVKKNDSMKIAAHLCGSRVNEVLAGETAFVSKLLDWGFRRVQINATAVNGVDTSKLHDSVNCVLSVVTQHTQLEFIIQKNEETRPLWEGILQRGLPVNMSMLVDESKGTGVAAEEWPEAPDEYKIGYAGGIGPRNVEAILEKVTTASSGKCIWIDMESSLRSTKNGKDVFDLDKCYEVLEAVCKKGLCPKPAFLS